MYWNLITWRVVVNFSKRITAPHMTNRMVVSIVSLTRMNLALVKVVSNKWDTLKL